MNRIIDQDPAPSQTLLPFPPSPPQYDLKSYYPAGPQRVPVADGPPKEPLGTSTNFHPVYSPKIDTETPYKAFRRVRFRLLETASQTSPKGHRLRGCCKHPSKDKHGEPVDQVFIEHTAEKARWKRISTCKLGWICPICAPRILARKQEEILVAQQLHRKTGGSTLLVTYTNSHKRGNGVKAYMDQVTHAASRMKSCWAYTRIKERYGLIGTIRSLEAPHGLHGWHVHAHEAWLVASGLTQTQCKALEKELFALWYIYCKRYKLGLPSRARGVRVDFRESDNPEDDAIGSYISKTAAELTGAVHKKSKLGGRTYFEILLSMQAKWTPRDAALAREYMSGTKGKSMVRWSRDLRALLGVDEAMEELDKSRESEKIPVTDVLAVSVPQFYAIATARLQGRVLEVVEDYGIAKAREYIELIHSQDTGAARRIHAGRAKRKLMETEPTHVHMHSMGMRITV